MFLSLIYVKDVLIVGPNLGEWYKIEAQAISNDKYLDQFKNMADERFLNHCGYTEHYEVWQHPTVKLSFKKGKRIH